MFFTVWILLGALLLLFGIPILRLSTGLLPNYSVGEREGYLTKLSHKGVIWKTWEAEMQIGTGNMSALQTPFQFSVEDKLAIETKLLLGQRVRVHYTEFMLMPYRYGETNYLLTAVTDIEKP
jgi:hypothetical protein